MRFARVLGLYANEVRRSGFYDGAPIFAAMELDSFKFLTEKVEEWMEARPIPHDCIAAAVLWYKEVVRNVYEMSKYGTTKNRDDANILQV